MQAKPTIHEVMKAWRIMHNHAGASRWPLIDQPVQTPKGKGTLMTVFGLKSRVAVNGKALILDTKDVKPLDDYEYRVLRRL